VKVENVSGRMVEGVVLLSECIHPECVGMDHAGGSWAKCLPPRRGGTGVHYGTLLDYEMKTSMSWTGPSRPAEAEGYPDQLIAQ